MGYSWSEGKDGDDSKDGCWSAVLMIFLPLLMAGGSLLFS